MKGKYDRLSEIELQVYADVCGKFKRRLDDKVIDKYTYINTYIGHAMPLFASQSLAGRVTVRHNASGFCIAYHSTIDV
jgi:hypothetical protein